MTGRVKSFNPSTRYGFITSGDVDYRFHINDWDFRLPPLEGVTVKFEPVETEKCMREEQIKHI